MVVTSVVVTLVVVTLVVVTLVVVTLVVVTLVLMRGVMTTVGFSWIVKMFSLFLLLGSAVDT